MFHHNCKLKVSQFFFGIMKMAGCGSKANHYEQLLLFYCADNCNENRQLLYCASTVVNGNQHISLKGTFILSQSIALSHWILPQRKYHCYNFNLKCKQVKSSTRRFPVLDFSILFLPTLVDSTYFILAIFSYPLFNPSYKDA